jgi:hypothetical protein
MSNLKKNTLLIVGKNYFENAIQTQAKVSLFLALFGKRISKVMKIRPRREDNIKMDLLKVGWSAWIGLIWLRIWTCGGHL